MKLKTIGYYKEMPHGQVTDPCMEEFINQEDVEQAEMICNYLRNGSALIVSPGETVDILHPEKGFSGTATAYTDGTWVWPGDLAYYVESYLLKCAAHPHAGLCGINHSLNAASEAKQN